MSKLKILGLSSNSHQKKSYFFLPLLSESAHEDMSFSIILQTVYSALFKYSFFHYIFNLAVIIFCLVTYLIGFRCILRGNTRLNQQCHWIMS